MSVARGAGWTCRWGCSDGNEICWWADPDGYSSETTIWSPHWECYWALLGSDTCTKGPDQLCQTRYNYAGPVCGTLMSTTYLYSAGCILIVQDGGTGS